MRACGEHVRVTCYIPQPSCALCESGGACRGRGCRTRALSATGWKQAASVVGPHHRLALRRVAAVIWQGVGLVLVNMLKILTLSGSRVRTKLRGAVIGPQAMPICFRKCTRGASWPKYHDALCLERPGGFRHCLLRQHSVVAPVGISAIVGSTYACRVGSLCGRFLCGAWGRLLSGFEWWSHSPCWSVTSDRPYLVDCGAPGHGLANVEPDVGDIRRRICKCPLACASEA